MVFDPKMGQLDNPITVPCGQCIGCRLEHSKQWAIRCMHESTLSEDNSFITLTYNDENLPWNNSIQVKEFQTFMKRLRKKYAPKKIRYFACGEYGSDETQPSGLGRPHYHAILFNHSFTDQILYTRTDTGDIFESEELNTLWGKGFATVAQVTFETAAYVARYTCKKINGEMAEEHYKHTDLQTGEIYDLVPEFALSSRSPPIGGQWLETYKTDCEKGFITMRGIKMKIPKAYDRIMMREDNLRYHLTKQKLKQNIDNLDPELSLNRLRVKEKVKQIRTKTLNRKL